jgi:hypothetical protein
MYECVAFGPVSRPVRAGIVYSYPTSRVLVEEKDPERGNP